MRICVVIPVHNESQGIAQVVRGVHQNRLDVIVIDDGSVDRSGDIAAENGAIVIKNQVRHGKGLSLQTGFQEALKRGYDALITMDGDGQHAPEDLVKFIAKAEGCPRSVITGSRMDDPKGMPWLRYLTNKFMSWLISLFCRQRIPDTQCGYRYIHREVLENIALTASDFEIETEVLMKASEKGYKILSVPVKTIYGSEESKINPVKDTIRFFAYLLREMRHK